MVLFKGILEAFMNKMGGRVGIICYSGWTGSDLLKTFLREFWMRLPADYVNSK